MKKTIKLNDDIFLDTSSIQHNHKSLCEIINDPIPSATKGIATKQLIKNVDFNNLPAMGTGLFIAMAVCTNAPLNSGINHWHWYVVQIVYELSNYSLQLAVPLHIFNRLWMRTCINKKWNTWEQIACLNDLS